MQWQHKGGAFTPYVSRAGVQTREGATLGRPLSLVVALTAGLEELGGGEEPTRRFLGGSTPADDNNGFLVLPGRDGRPLDGPWGGLLGGRYRFKRLIGVGTFAQIIEAEDTLSHGEPKKRVAIKVTRAGMQGAGMQEAQLLAFLKRCPGFHGANVVEAHAEFPLGEHWCLVMELLPGSLPDLVRQIRPFSLPMSSMRKLTMQLLVSLNFLSSQGIIHADIRPENVLLRDCTGASRGSARAPSLKVKLSDLGNSFSVSESAVYHTDFELQTLAYRAPEVLYGVAFDTQIDMWSLGCLLVEVYIGRRLFDAFNRSSAVATMAKTLGPLPRERFAGGRFYSALSSLPVYGTMAIDEDGHAAETNQHFNQPLQARLWSLLHCDDPAQLPFVSFLAGCLEYDPDHRLTALKALRHPFVEHLCPMAQLLANSMLSKAYDAKSEEVVGSPHSSALIKVEPALSHNTATSIPTAKTSDGKGRRQHKGEEVAASLNKAGSEKTKCSRRPTLGSKPKEWWLASKQGSGEQSDSLTTAASAKALGKHGGKSAVAARVDELCCGGDMESPEHKADKKRSVVRPQASKQASHSPGADKPGSLHGGGSALGIDSGVDSAAQVHKRGKPAQNILDSWSVVGGDSKVQGTAARRRVRRASRSSSSTSASDEDEAAVAARGLHDQVEQDNETCNHGESRQTGANVDAPALDQTGPSRETQAHRALQARSETGAGRGSSGVGKRRRYRSGMLAPTARRKASIEESGDEDSVWQEERRQSRRANIGSKPNEWWVAAVKETETSEPPAKLSAGGKPRGCAAAGGGAPPKASVLHCATSSLAFDDL